MIKTKFVSILILLTSSFDGQAQNIIVDSFENTSSVEARTHKRLDPNGIPCALIKVRCLLEGLIFKEAIGPVENETNEYWVFVPDKSEVLTISSDKIRPLIIRFADYGLKSVDTNVTYVLSLTEKITGEKSSFTSKSVPSDYWKGAESGNAEDQCNLGKCYYLGQGTVQNYYSAVAWFQKSAEQNWAEAQYQLGVCYEKGQGVKQNKKMAHKWFEKAAKNGNIRAKQKIQ